MKKYFEVFPTLQVDEDLQERFEEVEIRKITTTSNKKFLRVHICSHYVIPKQEILSMETKIKEQLFSRSGVKVTLDEEYELSAQYTPEHLFRTYYESFAFELGEASIMTENVFREAKWKFEDEGILCMEFPDHIVAQGRKDLITGYISNVFRDRFHIPIEVRTVSRHLSGKSRLKAESEMQLNREIASILEKNASLENTPKKDDPSPAEGGEKAGKPGEEKSAASAGKSIHHPKRKETGGKDPSLVYGRNFEDDDILLLSHVRQEMGEITFRGKVMNVETREIRNEKTILSFSMTDFTDSITVKMFTKNEQLPDILEGVRAGAFLKVRGVTSIDKFNGELTIMSVFGIKKIPDFTSPRRDDALEKRVELHCHTKMSDMDGVSDVKDIVKCAHDWGHKAIAITDHGVVQAFPDANHYIESLDPEDPFKIIYGVEGYLVDDLLEIAPGAGEQTLEDTCIVFDLETTGFSAIKDKIIEIGAVKVERGKITDRFSTFVNPKVPIPYRITNLTGITDQMVMDAPDIQSILPEFLRFIGDGILVAHNASFDVGFLSQACRYQDIQPSFLSVDTVSLARVLLPTISKYKLNNVAKALHISLENHHRAVDDAEATAEIFLRFGEMLKERGIDTLKGMNQFGSMNQAAIRKLPTYHVIILARNDIGRVNLYTLVSQSHLDYFARRPRIPKSQLNKYREGLLVGSACEAGELYRAILDNKSDERIAKIVDFYDYLEVQPLGNNAFMIESDRVSSVESEEDLRDINRKIVSLGEQFKKPVVATCDVHFLNPEDEVYRRIIMKGKGFDDADRQPPLYLHTTEEMLREFDYLGAAKAREIVIDNPGKIADQIEKISPVRPDKCPPVIENSDQTLRQICYDKAHSMYGENLPKVVTERLERELNSIISNGFAVMYIIAQKLVWKSNEDGYLVGSRGSVGSSFVATMAGITEVNPLSPHYYCPHCHYSDFDSEEVKAYAGGCGWDMPDKICPVCGEPLIKDGFNIPFETFLGFKGNKEPDIDLNFSGDYQSKAHRYTEVIFGAGQTFRAGTIGGLAEKTAFGYVKNYFEEHGDRKRKCEIDRLVRGCTGVRRTTGQHPGGIIVLPHGESIYSFTPIQHPANKMDVDIITTHFDYHSIDHNLLKLDILGHDDPTMIKMLEELVPQLNGGKPFRATDIHLDDPGVLSLFKDTSALGITPDDIDGCPVGCLGVPEFGTDFVIKMVVDTQPKTISDLIRISGLSHGTDVWLNNAQTLIEEGKATLSTAICTRDDIMTYLIEKGMDSEQSFSIMENVRKGKGLTPEMEEEMSRADVPDWYIDSCKKIKYMFPKAHAAAYVMMAFRIAYCKVYYPLAYYAAYFSIRATDFSYELMCQGKKQLEDHIKDYRSRKDSLSKKEQDTLNDMRVVQEMYARGYEFLPIDLYRSKATRFQIVDGKLLPPFNKIEGMGDKAAEAVELAAKDGPYLSLDDFRNRTKASKTVVDAMADMGLFGSLPESNQLSLFDLP